MAYNGEVSQARILCRKARSFAKGTLEGFLGTFVLPTITRKDRCDELYKGDYRDAGRISSSMLNLAGHLYVFSCLSDENDILAFDPIVATNFLSGAYELGRYIINIINRRRKNKEKNEK